MKIKYEGHIFARNVIAYYQTDAVRQTDFNFDFAKELSLLQRNITDDEMK